MRTGTETSSTRLGWRKISVHRFVEADERRDFVELVLRHLPDVIGRLDRGKIVRHKKIRFCKAKGGALSAAPAVFPREPLLLRLRRMPSV